MSQTKYSQVMEYLQGLVVSGEAYEAIPSERAISASLHISRMTVRKAIEDLCSRGILYRDGHRGPLSRIKPQIWLMLRLFPKNTEFCPWTLPMIHVRLTKSEKRLVCLSTKDSSDSFALLSTKLTH